MNKISLLILDNSNKFYSIGLLIKIINTSLNLKENIFHKYKKIFSKKILQKKTYIFLYKNIQNFISHENILFKIQKILNLSKVNLNKCKAIAFCSNPGSFTSSRIISCITQGFSYILNISIIPINLFLVYAENARKINKKLKYILITINYSIKKVYWAQYIWKNKKWYIINRPKKSLLKNIVIPNYHFALTGNSTNFHNYLKNIYKNFTNYKNTHSNISLISLIGLKLFESGNIYSYKESIPEYLQY